MAARSSYGVAAQPGCAARASAAALRTSAAVALPTLVILAPVAGSSTSSDPPAAFRHSVPKTRPRQVSSTRNFPAGAFITVSLPMLDPCRLLPPKAMLGWALRDIQENIARFQPGHGPGDFAEQGPASSKPLGARRLPAKIPAGLVAARLRSVRRSRAPPEPSVQSQPAPLRRLFFWIVRLGRAQQIPAKRAARLERDAEADLEAVRGFERGDQVGLPLGAFDRPFAKPEDIAGILI